MKTAYTALVILTLVVGSRFIWQFTSAVRDSREQTVRAAADVTASTSASETRTAHPTSPASEVGSSLTGPALTSTFAAPSTITSPRPNRESPPQPVRAAVSEPIRHSGKREDGVLLPGNFTWLGAFRPPHVEQQTSSFSYGGAAIAYRADGDPDGDADGFPGSLFLTGHVYDQQTAEISIPQPVISERRSLDDLTVSRLLQSFGDISGGIRDGLVTSESQPYRIGGLQVVGHALHWTLFRYYNVEGYDFYSHGISSLSMQQPMAAGPWHLGPFDSGATEWHAYKNAGYICDAPASVVERLGGRPLLSGLQISTGLQTSSQGPALYAYRLPDTVAPAGASLDAVPLLWYSMEQPLDQHHPADSWSGAAWLEMGDSQSVAFFGRKATGPVYYGEARPGDCFDSKGYHGPPYEAQVIFYRAQDLLEVADGQRQAFSLQPMYRWTGDSAGGGLSQYLFPTCDQTLGGLAYDRQHNLLYLVQQEAGTTEDSPYEVLPVIHVFRIGA